MPTQVVGYVSAIWADPNDSNYILAGTLGGLFKTTNGGTTWESKTDNAPLAGGAMGNELLDPGHRVGVAGVLDGHHASHLAASVTR